jgi:hypothetical protein
LLDHGANIFGLDASDQDSLKIAMRMLDVELAKLLLSHYESSPPKDSLALIGLVHETK